MTNTNVEMTVTRDIKAPNSVELIKNRSKARKNVGWLFDNLPTVSVAVGTPTVTLNLTLKLVGKIEWDLLASAAELATAPGASVESKTLPHFEEDPIDYLACYLPRNIQELDPESPEYCGDGREFSFKAAGRAGQLVDFESPGSLEHGHEVFKEHAADDLDDVFPDPDECPYYVAFYESVPVYYLDVYGTFGGGWLRF